MTEREIQRELQNTQIEPLLPVEKKLISWSFGIGVVLLVILIAANHYVPVSF
jgi:hypothetical protein